MAHRTMNFETWCVNNNRLDLLEEWNVERNNSLRLSKQPCDVEYNTPSFIHWICKENHEWESAVVARTNFNLQCPICYSEESVLSVGTKYGCLTIIGGFEEYKKEIANPIISQFKQDKVDFLNGIRKQNSNISSVEFYEDQIERYKNRKYYKCQCKCGQVQYLDEFQFLEKKRRYCVRAKNECGIKKIQKENLLASHERVYDDSYYFDYLHSIHESLEVIECIDDKYEELFCFQDKRKRGGGTYKIYKKYKCRCYLCRREHIVKSSALSINPPSDYGYRAYGGYYSEAFCDCHPISSFQWIVTKILLENTVSYRVEANFPDLYGIERVNFLRYDFAILNSEGSIKCLIECQGEQHYKPVREFGGINQFERQKKNDELKRVYAAENGIPLYNIPYTEKNMKM